MTQRSAGGSSGCCVEQAQSQPPLPQPQLEPTEITFEQYFQFTPEKLELIDGHLAYRPGSSRAIGFQLAVLTNMGLLRAIAHISVSLWIEALDRYLRTQLDTLNSSPEVTEAMLNRLNRAMEDLTAVVH